MSAFGDAFAAARKAGKKVFTFNGKKYHTRTKAEDDKRKAATTPVKTSGKMVQPKTALAGKTKLESPVPKNANASRAGKAYQRMASGDGGVPGKKTSTTSRTAPKSTTRSRRDTPLLNAGKTTTVSKAEPTRRRRLPGGRRGRIPR